ncbi:sugar ABC transporter permease [Acidothermaceae bacterium B102]|nr:sugar ABC transporter permease [Acidothermaceae bacterium B102]
MATMTAAPRIAVRERSTGSVRKEGLIRRLPLLPALVFMIVLTQIPFLLTIWYSLQSWNLLHPDRKHFAGLNNYRIIFKDTIFRTAVFNTIEFTILPVLLSVAFGLGIAILLDRHVFGRGFLRTLIISPFLVMPAAAALVWKFTILDTSFGVLNWFIHLFGFGHVDWISTHPQLTIITVLTWQWTPFMVLILLSGLQSQGTDLLEAARVDGATNFRIFRSLTLPHLRQYLELGVLLGSIYIVQAFDAIFMITAGGPGQKTTNLPYYIYETAFRGFSIGIASAMGVVVVVATIVVSTLALRVVSSLFSDEGMAGR